VATDLPFGHAADELGPGVLRSSERHTRLSGVVEELIVLNPEGSVPGFVVCPTVVGGHGSVRLVDGFSLQGHGLVGLQAVTVHPLSQTGGGVPHCCQDGTAGDISEAVGLPAAGELHSHGARDRIGGQAMNGG